MKKTLLIVAGIGLLSLLLIVWNFTEQHGAMKQEREWFTQGLRYKFSARVDSIRMLTAHTGRLRCQLTSGDPQVHREDSLKALFKEHDMLYFIFKRSADSITFIVPNGDLVAIGDSVHVSSQSNSIKFFRHGKQVAQDKLSNTLTGYGRPFFMKRGNKN